MKVEIFYDVYKEKLNNYSVATTEGVGFLQRYLEGNVPSEGAEEILATHYAEIFGQDGDKGAQKHFLRAKDTLISANVDNLECGLATKEPTEADIATEEEAHAGADLVSDAHYELGKNGEFSLDTMDRIRNFGVEQVEDSAQ